MIVALSFTKPTVVFKESIPIKGGQLIVVNHQGSMDPFLVASTIPIETTAVSKIENMNIPVLGTWLRSIEAISFHRESLKESVKVLKEVAKRLENKRSVVIFPEGTRSLCNDIGEFKAGALKAAYLAKADIVVVILVNSYTILDNASMGRKPVSIIYDGVIAYDEYKGYNTQELAAQIKQRMQKRIDEYSSEETT